MPRMLRRAAVLGATASAAKSRGAAAAQAQQHQAPPATESSATPVLPEQAAAGAPAHEAVEYPYGDLVKLKGLLDAGVLTQTEFDAQKQTILHA